MFMYEVMESVFEEGLDIGVPCSSSSDSPSWNEMGIPPKRKNGRTGLFCEGDWKRFVFRISIESVHIGFHK